jgi:uncharacterized protein (TIGR03905 family)
MFSYDYRPSRVCPRNIHVAVSDDGTTIERVEFEGGCNGNTKAVAKLVQGKPVDEIVELLAGKDNLLNAQQNQLQSKYLTLYNQQMLAFYQGGEIK